jgi:hypothetical protein
MVCVSVTVGFRADFVTAVPPVYVVVSVCVTVFMTLHRTRFGYRGLALLVS